jgi:membrane protein involved in colicin uptake
MEARHVSDSSFLTAAQELLNTTSQPSTSTIRQGELAQRLLQMQQEKNKANEDRKIAILEAKYEAEVKKAEEQAKKRLEQQKFKAEQAQARARDAAEKKEKRRYEAELKRKAKEETRKFIAEVLCREEKKGNCRKETAREEACSSEKRGAATNT